MNPFPILIRIAAGFVLATLAACGGGGGGGGGGTPPVVYSGNTSAAIVTTANASNVTANVIGSDDASAIIGGVSVESSNVTQNQGTGPADLARRLSRGFRELVVSKNMRPNQQAVTGFQFDETQPCDFDNGTLRIFGPLDDDFLTGTVTIVFSNCLIEGVTLNGTGTMRIDVFLTDFTMSFARLTLRGTGLSVDAGGSIRFQEIGNTVTITMNLIEAINNTGKMRKTVDLMIVEVYDNTVSPTTFTQTLTGQVFHSDHGFVTVNSLQAFVFGPPIQPFPHSGQMVLTGAPEGASNRTIRVTALTAPPAALPATLARLELDLDGDGILFEIDARLKWTELTRPVGDDLADGDGDGMHNSWESFYGGGGGLDPNINNDLDAFTNLEEYMAGTNPIDTSSHP